MHGTTPLTPNRVGSMLATVIAAVLVLFGGPSPMATAIDAPGWMPACACEGVRRPTAVTQVSVNCGVSGRTIPAAAIGDDDRWSKGSMVRADNSAAPVTSRYDQSAPLAQGASAANFPERLRGTSAARFRTFSCGRVAANATHDDNDLGQVAQIAHRSLGAEKRISDPTGDLVDVERLSVAAKGAIDIRPPLSIGSKQFGTKWDKHAADYGLDPESSSSRTWFMNRARDVHLNPDEVRRGAWNPAGGGGENYFFFR
ncbi:hypothetical protein AUCHE_08_04220 [Austwickia chelonae NBRC 105200]|uniref:Uncharacterized protein n=2 Tax=Austwickia TaxID=1184606 RepID=K6W8M9_9MICO|nr:hypothetical protein AUCHE_08_04220 [Austwickia chelonae NBRC 105200]